VRDFIRNAARRERALHEQIPKCDVLADLESFDHGVVA
jgi:hypothetical protein